MYCPSPSSSSRLTGWARHQHFGLRSEWLDMYLVDPDGWHDKCTLGPRQVQALDVWLTTCDLRERGGEETALANLFRALGPQADLAWQILWANLTFRFPTAGWYVSEMGIGSWSTRQLRQALGRAVPRLSPRTVNNAIMELVGTLERTPLGSSLGQGAVTADRPRWVHRVGLGSPAPRALAHALRLAFLAERRATLHLDEAIRWPWIVFGCDAGEALGLLHALGERWMQINEDSIHCSIPLEALEHVPLL